MILIFYAVYILLHILPENIYMKDNDFLFPRLQNFSQLKIVCSALLSISLPVGSVYVALPLLLRLTPGI